MNPPYAVVGVNRDESGTPTKVWIDFAMYNRDDIFTFRHWSGGIPCAEHEFHYSERTGDNVYRSMFDGSILTLTSRENIDPEFVILKVEKGVYGQEDRITIYKVLPNDKALQEYFNYQLDVPTSGEEYHKAYLTNKHNTYFAPIINQEYTLTKEN